MSLESNSKIQTIQRASTLYSQGFSFQPKKGQVSMLFEEQQLQ